MTQTDLTQTLASLRTAFAERLGIRAGRDLAATLRRAGRRVPRHLRPAAAALVQAESMAANPRLARMVDQDRIDSAATDLQAWLDTQDPRERRRTAILNTAALIAFRLLLVAGLVIALLAWRGAI